MATNNEIRQIHSAIPWSIPDADGNASGFDFLSLQWLTSSYERIPPYWSRQRDRALREFYEDVGPIKTAVATFVNKAVTIPFHIRAKDSTMQRHVVMAKQTERNLRRLSGSMSSTPLAGFEVAFKSFLVDYLTQDNGGHMLVIGPGRADGPIIGSALGVLHLDAAKCTRTRNPEFPVKYMHDDGREYKLHYTRVITMVNLPSPRVELCGVGLCPLSCCIESAQELSDIYRHSQERFGSRPPRQILYAKTGATIKNLTDFVNQWQIKLNNRNQTHFGGTMFAAPKAASQTLELDVLNLSAAPDGFDRRDTTIIDKSEIAAAFGLDLRDLAFSFGVAGQTRADAEVQDRKGRGKGVGEFLETFTKRFNEVFLNNDLWEINFDYLDDEQDEQQATIRDLRSLARERDLTAGVTTVRVERELMWQRGEISQENFEDMELLDGRLPNGLDVMFLFQSQDRQFEEWLDLGVDDPTNIEQNDPDELRDRIHDRKIEVARFINAATSIMLSRKARQALAALEKLEAMYEPTEEMILDDQAMLEAEADGDVARGEDVDIVDDETKEKKSLQTKQVLPGAPTEVDSILSEYEQQLINFIELAIDGEMPRRRFDEVVAELIAEALLALFLRGGGFVFAEIPPDAITAIQAEIEIHLRSLQNLADDVYAGRYNDDNLGIAGVISRVSAWIGIAGGMYYMGLLYRADDPFLLWNRDPLKDSCTDCLRLNGQVHLASEWRSSGWRPRAYNLECHGVHCGCSYEITSGPSRGNF